MLSSDFLEPLRTGLLIAVIVTAAALLTAVPLGYALARLRFPGRVAVLLAFLLPQAFPQLPVFASATREFYRWGLAGTVTPSAATTRAAGRILPSHRVTSDGEGSQALTGCAGCDPAHRPRIPSQKGSSIRWLDVASAAPSRCGASAPAPCDLRRSGSKMPVGGQRRHGAPPTSSGVRRPPQWPLTFR